MDIASLGIEVRTDGVNRATQDLNRLSQACDEVDSAAEGVGQSFRQTSQGLGSANAQTRQAAINLRDVGVSARQTQAALRQLPAQFSDIVISLQGGQNPLSVFLQQGSQIKDSFGGVGPALRETARYAAGLINPFTVGASVVGALGIAAYKGSQEITAFNKSLILTNSYATSTGEQLQYLSKQYADLLGVTQGSASSALAGVAGSGFFTGTQFEDVSRAAIAMQDTVGKSIDDTVSEFRKLADDPVNAAIKLNDQYHVLTATTYEQIAAMAEQGDQAGAASLAISTFADAQVKMSMDVKENLGILESAWRSLGKTADEAWDSMKGIGREQTLEDQLAVQQEKLQRLRQIGGGVGIFDNSFDVKRTQEEVTRLFGLITERDSKAFQTTIETANREEGLRAQQFVNGVSDLVKSNKDKRKEMTEKLDKAIVVLQRENPESEFLKAENLAALRAGIDEKYKDPKTRTPRQKVFQDDAATRMLLSLKEQQGALESQLLVNEKLTSEQKKRAEFEALIAQLKSKDVLTAEQKSLLASQDAIKAQLDRNVAISEEVRLRQESIKFQERAAQIEARIKSASEGRKERYQRLLEGAGLGARERQRLNEQNDLSREYTKARSLLAESASENKISGSQYESELAKINSIYKSELASIDNFYREDDKKRANWVNGANDAFADYIDSAKNVSGQTYDLFNKAFGGIEDSIVDFVMTGKLSFSDLANSIIADLVRIEARKAIAFAIGGSESGGGSGFGGLLKLGFTAASAYFGGGLSASAAGSLAAGSSQLGYAQDLSNFVAGARAGGGPVSAGSMYQVGENNRPELLTQGGRSYLIPGDGGNVTPIRGNGGGGGPVTNVFNLPNVTNAREAREAAGILQRSVGRAVQGSGRYM
ncbi:phage tail tape measure protein [Metapseudomonas otitidis]|uniref:phage tail tape measure protein n=1 Tax=Metapseudomonas otitidis TaxID=319939 RepID=UPI003CF9693E